MLLFVADTEDVGTLFNVEEGAVATLAARGLPSVDCFDTASIVDCFCNVDETDFGLSVAFDVDDCF